MHTFKKHFKKTIIYYIVFLLFFFTVFMMIYSSNPSDQLHAQQLSSYPLPFLNLFMHNLFITLLIIVLGNITFGIGSILFIIYNLTIIAWKIVAFYDVTGDYFSPFMSVFIHGFIELFALALTLDLSLKSLETFLAYRKTKKICVNFKSFTYKILLIVMLLVVAAFIESTITPQIIKSW